MDKDCDESDTYVLTAKQIIGKRAVSTSEILYGKTKWQYQVTFVEEPEEIEWLDESSLGNCRDLIVNFHRKKAREAAYEKRKHTGPWWLYNIKAKECIPAEYELWPVTWPNLPKDDLEDSKNVIKLRN